MNSAPGSIRNKYGLLMSPLVLQPYSETMRRIVDETEMYDINVYAY